MCVPCDWNQILALAALLLLEWWLGGTEKVKAGSTIGLIISGLKLILRRRK